MQRLTFSLLLILATAAAAQDDYYTDELRPGEAYLLGVVTSVENRAAVIDGVVEGSAAAQIGLRVGDVILRINDQRGFTSPDDFRERLREQAEAYHGFVILRYRRGDRIMLAPYLLDAGRFVTRGGEQVWQSRRLRHGRMAHYLFHSAAAANCLTNEFDAQHAPRNPTTREAIAYAARIYREMGLTISQVNTDGLPEDLQRVHAGLQSAYETAAMRIESAPADNGNRAMQIMGDAQDDMFDAATELSRVIRYYERERPPISGG